MSMPKWIVVAKNEYRIRTSAIRKIRPVFPYLVIGLLALYVLYIAPEIVDLFSAELTDIMLSQAALATVEIMLFILFIYFLFFPVTSTLREESSRQLEIFLSAPVKASDILLGEFMGTAPLYAIIVIVIISPFTSVLTALHVSRTQIIMTIAVFVLIFLSAHWCGTVIAALLRTKLGQTARGKDIGKALAIIIVLPLLALFYLVMFGGVLETLADPATSGLVRTLLGWLPSSWGAQIIIGFTLHPGEITGLEALQMGGLITFTVAVFYLGVKVADRAYRLKSTTFTSTQVNPHTIFSRALKRVIGQPLGTLVVSLFKDYVRHVENISYLAYMTGLIVIMLVLVAAPLSEIGNSFGVVFMVMIVQLFSPILSIVVARDVTIRGKETLFMYRKAPSGQERFVKAMLLRNWLITVPLMGAFVVLLLGSSAEPALIVYATGLTMVSTAGVMVFVLGIFLLNPAFSEKSLKLKINIVVTFVPYLGVFMISMVLFLLSELFVRPTGGITTLALIQLGLGWLVGVTLFFMGKERLKRIE